jgi:hypothetical protein
VNVPIVRTFGSRGRSDRADVRIVRTFESFAFVGVRVEPEAGRSERERPERFERFERPERPNDPNDPND